MSHLLIHNATNVTTSGVTDSNSNAITLTVSTKSVFGDLPHTITIFGLPAHVADALEELLGKGGVKPTQGEDNDISE
jgi:hypothetical protein